MRCDWHHLLHITYFLYWESKSLADLQECVSLPPKNHNYAKALKILPWATRASMPTSHHATHWWATPITKESPHLLQAAELNLQSIFQLNSVSFRHPWWDTWTWTLYCWFSITRDTFLGTRELPNSSRLLAPIHSMFPTTISLHVASSLLLKVFNNRKTTQFPCTIPLINLIVHTDPLNVVYYGVCWKDKISVTASLLYNWRLICNRPLLRDIGVHTQTKFWAPLSS